MTPYHEIYASPNHWSSRRGYKIVAAGVHISGGEFESNHSWIMNPNAQASYNCLIKRDGKRVNYVPEEFPAHSHGLVNKGTWPLLAKYPGANPNWYTLSVARVGSNQNLWTPEQMESTIEILRYWSGKYGFPLKRPYVFGHFEIDSVDRWYCPGAPFFDELIKRLGANKEGSDMAGNVIVVNTEADVPVAKRLVERLSGHGTLVFRTATKELAEKGAETVYILGGGRDGLPLGRVGTVIDLSGDTFFHTAQNVGHYLKVLT